MQVISVNVSAVKEVLYRDQPITTGIYKEPVGFRVRVGELGLEGDAQADRRVHGGPDMAVYAYPVQHYAYWQSELDVKKYPFGQFGENLTVSGLREESVRVGDMFRIGSALLQVTAPRIPCYKLALRMEQPNSFILTFQKSGRVGFYLRVIEEGELGVDDPIERVQASDDAESIAGFLKEFTAQTPDPDRIEKILRSPGLPEPWAKHFQKRQT